MENIPIANRPVCSIEGCGRTVMSLGLPKLAKLCRRHYKLKYGMCIGNKTQRKKKHIPNVSCVFCGWDKGPCDRHRIIYGVNGGLYTLENTISLCPNCHRLLHLNLITIEQIDIKHKEMKNKIK